MILDRPAFVFSVFFVEVGYANILSVFLRSWFNSCCKNCRARTPTAVRSHPSDVVQHVSVHVVIMLEPPH